MRRFYASDCDQYRGKGSEMKSFFTYPDKSGIVLVLSLLACAMITVMVEALVVP